ncbi:Ubiquinone/menaquinone biosynthesis C-methyltransferase UbiE [Candidatus Gugararchaeum adminiculabundum]|nr:Ubiquinone/menaquinone biosynthesis C-methyltransferase UbiE [Candidatus Gugararchaeum adminiculabundum]
MLPQNRAVKSKWMKYAPQYYWGDDLDVRYYLLEQLRQLHGKKILDLGCGPGVILSEIPEDNERFGIDISKESLDFAKKVQGNEKTNFILGTVTGLPFQANSFDVLICANAVPGVDYAIDGNIESRQEEMFSEIVRVLKKGGTLYLSTPNGAHPYFQKKSKMKMARLETLLKKFFGSNYEIFGYKPIPLPKILRSKILAKIPGVERWLYSQAKNPRYKNSGWYFYVEAIKK